MGTNIGIGVCAQVLDILFSFSSDVSNHHEDSTRRGWTTTTNIESELTLSATMGEGCAQE